jgi:Icc-related predicted phosphoesterase
MEILVVSDIHNDVENIISYIDKISMLQFDVVVCPGDFSDYSFPKGFVNLDITKLVLENLKTLGKPILAVPGNWDKDVIQYLERNGVSVHGRGKIIDGVGFFGYGGAHTPFGTPLEPTEDEIKHGLDAAYKDVEKCGTVVLVTHIPPARTRLDIVSTGAHVGSEVVRKFIEDKQPAAAICAHVHEAKGTDEIKATKIINAGRFPEGYCGLISIDGKEVKTKLVNLI